MTQTKIPDEKNSKIHVPDKDGDSRSKSNNPEGPAPTLVDLQQQVGNRAVQRLIAQRSGQGSFELDDATANRINNQRGGGQALDSSIQTQMGSATGHDFKDVRVHTTPDSDDLNREVGARAFTTGNDIFFREGQYNPHSSSGQELIAHELTHVVQQNSGRVTGGGRMTVNPPDDDFEQEADSNSKTALLTGSGSEVQRQEAEEEEEVAQTQAVQRQETEEEEEEITQTKAIQRQDIPEEEEVAQTKALQRQETLEEEEVVQPKALQRQDMLEEEEV